MQSKSKTTLQFILGSFMVLAIAAGCGDSSSTKETTKDSTVTDTPAVTDTNRMDTAKTKPIVNPPDETNK
jgi:hypothetical protein